MKLLIALTIFLSTFTITGQEFHTEKEQKFHTEFEYTDLLNKGFTIQNSYPKGGQKYTSPSGKEYANVVFWTSITNQTDSDLELKIDFSADSFIIPLWPNVNFNLYLPSEEMTLEKEPLFNYGLDLKSFLDENIEKPSVIVKTISPNESFLFYTVAISDKGADGTIRAGFEIENQDLIYKINGHKINCGKITTK